MEKPTFKIKVGIYNIDAEAKIIRFDAPASAIDAFEELGNIYHRDGARYVIYVDSRYNFQEVLDYISSYGEEDSDV